MIERLARGEGKEYAHSAAERLDENALTLGFARRLATYKRLDLLLADPDRMLALLGAEDRPVQLLVAGKAHPKDDGGKRLVTRLFEYRYHPQFAGRVIFLDDYDIALAATLVRGCDVWVNVPRPPLEASGTSGMKNAVNGGLQLSVLDGWWPEAYDGTNGWAISGDVDDDHGAQDHRHARTSTACSARRSCRRSTTAATAPAARAAGSRWCARRSRRSGRGSARRGWSPTTSSASTRPTDGGTVGSRATTRSSARPTPPTSPAMRPAPSSATGARSAPPRSR